MNGKPCAASDTKSNWFDIDFESAEKSVKKLQKRIYVAYSRNEIDKLMYLQNRMIHSFDRCATVILLTNILIEHQLEEMITALNSKK